MSKVMGVAIPRVKRSPSTGGARASMVPKVGGTMTGREPFRKKTITGLISSEKPNRSIL
jgi:hypothetical protein